MYLLDDHSIEVDAKHFFPSNLDFFDTIECLYLAKQQYIGHLST